MRRVRYVPRGFSWLLIVAIITVVAASALAWWKLHERSALGTVVASVNGHAITQATFSQALRDRLWQRGANWELMAEPARQALRKATLEALTDNLLLKLYLESQPGSAPPLPSVAEAEFQQFLKQFSSEEGWQERMSLQGLTEVQLRDRLAGDHQQRTGLEAALSPYFQPPDEKAARAWYEAHRSDLTLPARARASHVFLTRHDKGKPDRTGEMTVLEQKLAGGEMFDSVARQNSDDERSKKLGGDLGWFSRSRVPEDFATAVFVLTPGQTSPVISTGLGWHLVRVTEKKPERAATFTEVKEDIIALLTTEARLAALRQFRDSLRAGARINIVDSVLSSSHPTPLR